MTENRPEPDPIGVQGPESVTLPPGAQVISETRESKLWRWRYGQFRKCGLSVLAAEWLAHSTASVEDARKLAAKGCPAYLIFDIIAETNVYESEPRQLDA